MKLSIHITRDESDRYTASCPSLPGCSVRADNPDAARDRLSQAIEGYLSSMNVAVPRDISENLVEC